MYAYHGGQHRNTGVRATPAATDRCFPRDDSFHGKASALMRCARVWAGVWAADYSSMARAAKTIRPNPRAMRMAIKCLVLRCARAHFS